MTDMYHPEKDHIESDISPAEKQGMDSKLANAEPPDVARASKNLQISDNAQIKNEMKAVLVTDAMEADKYIENANTAPLIDGEIDTKTVQKHIGESSIWKTGPVERGRHFETVKNANIAGNFPVIDDFDTETGVAISYKTVDMNLDSYQNPKKLEGKIEKDIDALSDFNGRTWHQDGKAIEIVGDDIQEKVLCVGVPPGPISTEQENALLRSKEYAAKREVKLRFEKVA